MNSENNWKKWAKEHAALWTLLESRGPRETLFMMFAWASYSQGEDGLKARILKAFVAARLGRLTRRLREFEAELQSKTDDELQALFFEWETQREIEQLECEVEASTEDATNDSNELAGDWWKGE